MYRKSPAALRTAAVLLSLTLLLCIVPRPASAVAANPPLKVGLTKDPKGNSWILPGVNLQNQTGSGYRFGFMKNGEFIEIGSTAETKISMVKNRNVYVTSSGDYSDSVTTGTLIGCYHTEDGVQKNREEAERRAAALRAEGKGAFVYYESGKWGVRVGSYASSSNAAYVTGSKYCITIVRTGTNDIIFQYDSGSVDNPLTIAPDITGAARPFTWFKGYKYAGLFQYTRMDQNDITVVNLVDMQEYLKGVVPREMDNSWPLEALKAQALCARSYCMYSMGKHKSAGFDVCNNEHCQVYGVTNSATAHSDRAVDETYGLYVTYKGTVCETVFSSCSGGATEDSENVWGNYVPYLRGVQDIHEDLTNVPVGTWSYTTNNAALSAFLTSKGYSNSGVVNFYVSEYTRMGNVKEITFVDSSGKRFTFNKENVRKLPNSTAFGLDTNSPRYTINGSGAALISTGSNGVPTAQSEKTVWVVGADGLPKQISLTENTIILSASGISPLPKEEINVADGTYVISGRGWGHNVGMSQYGARSMALKGFTFDEIIHFYFTDVDITQGS